MRHATLIFERLGNVGKFTLARALRRPQSVVLEPPAQPLAADNPQLVLVDVAVWGFCRLAIHRRLILQRLVRPFLVVMLNSFRHQMVHVLLTEHDKVIESLLLQSLDEPLDIGVGVRRPKCRLFPFCPAASKIASNAFVICPNPEPRPPDFRFALRLGRSARNVHPHTVDVNRLVIAAFKPQDFSRKEPEVPCTSRLRPSTSAPSILSGTQSNSGVVSLRRLRWAVLDSIPEGSHTHRSIGVSVWEVRDSRFLATSAT